VHTFSHRFASIKTVLNNTKLQVTNSPLYQVIDDIINSLIAFDKEHIALNNPARGNISFPIDQLPSVESNILDEYREGEWIPFDASGAGLVFTNASGDFVKIGQLVMFSARFDYPATANGANAIVGGLPYTVKSAPPGNSWGAKFSFTTLAADVTMPCLSGTKTFGFYAYGAAPITNAQMTGVVSTVFGIYRAAQ